MNTKAATDQDGAVPPSGEENGSASARGQAAKSSVKGGGNEPAQWQEETDSSLYGIEYAVLAATLLAAFFLLNKEALQLLRFLYHPYLIFLLIVMVMEYIVLKARDRSYMLEKELEQQRELQQRRQSQLEQIERELEGWEHALENEDAPGLSAEEERERIRHLLNLTRE